MIAGGAWRLQAEMATLQWVPPASVTDAGASDGGKALGEPEPSLDRSPAQRSGGPKTYFLQLAAALRGEATRDALLTAYKRHDVRGACFLPPLQEGPASKPELC